MEVYDMWLRSNERNVGMGQDCSLQIAVEEIGLVFYALERSIGYYFLLMETFFFIILLNQIILIY
jgi:hypothetical protein